MILVWGKRTDITLAWDQEDLRDLTPVCLKRGCGGRCQLYEAKRYCTMYFCIQLCQLGPTRDLVKCEACGTMWLKEAYLPILKNARKTALERFLVQLSMEDRDASTPLRAEKGNKYTTAEGESEFDAVPLADAVIVKEDPLRPEVV
jgi:predicted Zn finger-like uncharacterized protein